MSDYAHRPGGSLKFKGDDGKKKKKKSHSSSDRTAADPAVASSKKIRDVQEKAADRSLAELENDEDDLSREKELELERALAAQAGKGGQKMTEAERRFEEKRRQRREQRVAKSATQTHKDRVKEFNDKMDRMTDHNDIPKISWTG